MNTPNDREPSSHDIDKAFSGEGKSRVIATDVAFAAINIAFDLVGHAFETSLRVGAKVGRGALGAVRSTLEATTCLTCVKDDGMTDSTVHVDTL